MTKREGRRFGLTVGIAFVVIAALLLWREHQLPGRVTGALGIGLVLGGLLLPTRLGPVERMWMGLAHLISKVTTPLFMAIVYYGVITPFGLVRRALGGRSLQHGEVGTQSYWQDKDTERSGGLDRQF